MLCDYLGIWLLVLTHYDYLCHTKVFVTGILFLKAGYVYICDG